MDVFSDAALEKTNFPFPAGMNANTLLVRGGTLQLPLLFSAVHCLLIAIQYLILDKRGQWGINMIKIDYIHAWNC